MELTSVDFFEYLKTGKGKLLTCPKLPLTLDIPTLVGQYITAHVEAKEIFAYNLWQVVKDQSNATLERIYATLVKYPTVLSYTSRLICLDLLQEAPSKDQQSSYLDLLNQIVVTNPNIFSFIGTRTHIVAGGAYVVDMLTYNKHLKGSLMDQMLAYPNIKLALTEPLNSSSLISDCYLSELGVLTNLKKSILPRSCTWLKSLEHEYLTYPKSRGKISTLVSQINVFGCPFPDVETISELLKTTSLVELDHVLKLYWTKTIATKYRSYLLKVLRPLFQNNLAFLIAYITYHLERPTYEFPQHAALLNHISALYQKQPPCINTAYLPGKALKNLLCDLILTGANNKSLQYTSLHLHVNKHSPETRSAIITLLYHISSDRDLTNAFTELLQIIPGQELFKSFSSALKSTPLRTSLIEEIGAETNYHTATLLLTEHMLAGGAA